jgi:acyl-CoA synthetase (AMP-forming)/AMP-acid ligase II
VVKAASTDILAAVLDACEKYGNASALTFGKSTLTYRELREKVLRTASSLKVLGMVPGDHVLFSVRPGLDATCLALGIIAAGGAIVFADPGAGEAMFRARAELAAARWVAAESLLYFASSGPLRGVARRRGIELPPYSTVVPDARHIVSGPWLPGVPWGAVAVHTLSAPGGTEPVVDLGNPAAEALIIFTSGTTADPKAVVHSRLSLGTGLADFVTHTQLRAGDRVLTDQLMVGIPALIAGSHWMLPRTGASPGATPSSFFDLLPHADVIFAVPAALDSLLTLLETEPDSAQNLRTVLIGGAPVLRPLLERVRAQLPEASVKAIYGMTELLPVAIADGDEKLAFGGQGDYVGELASTVKARISATGELVLSGPGLMLGYLGKPPLKTLPTGDLARIEGGRLILNGRSKDMFIRGTTNVYPGLYEPVIAGLPGVRDVAMVGVPDAIGDDRIVLVIVPTDPPHGLAREHPVLTTVEKSLPGLIDAGVLPDVLLAAPELPHAGRGRKLDRVALVAQVTKFLRDSRPL